MLTQRKKNKGEVVAVTTDGFRTYVSELETKLFKLKDLDIPLFKLFKKLRVDLNDDPTTHTVLELKQNKTGIVSWSTRGQLGGSSNEILATTGFQSKGWYTPLMRRWYQKFKDTLKGH
jgi:hypothetical protein